MKTGCLTTKSMLVPRQQLSGIDMRRLDDGTGIVSTLVNHNVVYHKSCRSACNSSHVKRARDTLEKQYDASSIDPSPKKLRSSISNANSIPVKRICVVCEDNSGDLHKVASYDVSDELKVWALQTKNFLLHARLVTVTADALPMLEMYVITSNVTCHFVMLAPG